MTTGLPPSSLGANIGTIDSSGSFSGSAGPITAVDNIINVKSAMDSQTWVKLEYTDGDGNLTNQQGFLNDGGCLFLVVDTPSPTVVSVYTGGTDSNGPSWGSKALVSVTVSASSMDPSETVDIWLDTETNQPYANPAIALQADVDPTKLSIVNKTGLEDIEVWVNGGSKVCLGTHGCTLDLTGARYQWSIAFAESDSGDPQIVIKRPPNHIAS